MSDVCPPKFDDEMLPSHSGIQPAQLYKNFNVFMALLGHGIGECLLAVCLGHQRHTVKPGTPEHWRNTQPNTGRTIGIPRNSGACEEQRNNATTKQHQQIVPIQTDDILNRYNKIQNKSYFSKKDFYGKVKPGQKTVSM